MATEILRPQDCLRPSSHFYDPFSPHKQIPNPNRRRSRPATKPAAVSPPSSNKHGRPNPKSARKASPSSSSSSSSSPSSSPLSTSPVHEGFRLLKRGEQFRPATAAAVAAQSGSEKKSPVESSSKHKKHELSTEALVLQRSEPPVPVTRVEKTLPQKKPQSDWVSKPNRLKSPPPPPPRPLRFGSDRDSCFAGPNFAVQAPEASCLPQPGFLLRSSSVGGPTSDDEASRALRSLLKLQFL